MEIREARESDFEALARLAEELGRPQLTESNRGLLRRVFDILRSDPNAVFMVAQADGEIIGAIRVQIRYRLNFAHPEAWISDFIVTEKQRSRGVGRTLLRNAIRVARERQCVRLLLESGYQRVHAHALYLSDGFVDSGKTFTLKLNTE